MLPTWYKQDKYEKFLKQWEIRKDFEQLKMEQATSNTYGDVKQ